MTYESLDVFDVKENKYLIKGITRQALSEMLDVTRNAISNYICTGKNLKGKYHITISEVQGTQEPVKVYANSFPVDLLKEWDEMTLAAELIRTGKGYIATRVVDGEKVKVTIPKGAIT